MMTAVFDPAALSVNSNTWLEILLSLSVKGLLILLIAAGLSFGLRKSSAAARHLVWSLALASLLALPILAFGLPSLDVPILPRASSIERSGDATAAPLSNAPLAQERRPVAALAQSSLEASRGFSASTQSGQPFAAEPEGMANEAKAEAFSWATWALIVWLAGVLLILSRLLVGTASVGWMARRSQRISDENWVALANRLAFRLGLARRVTLFKSRTASMPLTFGIMRSSILLPAGADDWSDERREVVLLHELAHVKRRDCLMQMLAQVACAIYWFNPLIWIAARSLRVERERACDDQVLDAGAKASDYADHLLDIARHLGSSQRASFVAVAIARRSQLEGRLLAILDPNVRRCGLSRIASLAVGIAIALIVLPLASLRPSAQARAIAYEPAERMAAIANESFNRKQSAEPVEKAAFAQTAPPAGESDTALLAEAQPSEAPTTEPEPASSEQQPKPEPSHVTQQERDSAAEALNEALKDEDPQVREQALFALSQIEGPRATGVLLSALKDPNPQVREKAAWGLGMRRGDALIEPLIDALRDSNSQVREKAAWALGLNGNGRAIEPLMNALKDEDQQVREKAAWALGLKGDTRAVESLMNALKDESPQVRGMSAWALGMRGDKRAMKALSDAMKDQNKEVRGKAAWALGMLLVNNSQSEKDDDRDLDLNIDLDTDGSGAGSGEGSGKGKGKGSGAGTGVGKPKAKP